MTDYSKMTDVEIDVEVAKALGCKILTHSCGSRPSCACVRYNHGDGQIFNMLVTYSTSWQFAGPILEMMGDFSLGRDFDETGMVWDCYSNFAYQDDDYLHCVNKSPTRSICQAFLKWRDVDPENFKQAIK